MLLENLFNYKLAFVVVNNANDAGQGSLRQTIITCNFLGDVDINFIWCTDYSWLKF